MLEERDMLETELKSTRDNLSDRENELESLKDKFSSANKEIERLNISIENLNKQYTDLNDDLNDKEKRLFNIIIFLGFCYVALKLSQNSVQITFY